MRHDDAKAFEAAWEAYHRSTSDKRATLHAAIFAYLAALTGKSADRPARPEHMTDAEVMAELGSGSSLDKARAVFSSCAARMEQEAMQRKPAGPMEMRRAEFDAVKAILAAYLGTGEDGRPLPARREN